jgi:hypothetical protein
MNYYNSPAISQSDIKSYIECPELFYEKKFNGYKESATDELKFGSLVDAMIFESGEFFKECYYVIPEGQETRRNTTIGKKFWEDIKLEQAGKNIVTFEEYSEALKMIDVLKEDKIANFLFFDTKNIVFGLNQLEIQ